MEGGLVCPVEGTAPCSVTSCSTNSTESWSFANLGSRGMRTRRFTVGYLEAVEARAEAICLNGDHGEWAETLPLARQGFSR